MDLITLFLLAVGLSFDTFAVSVSSGVARKEIRFLPATLIAFTLAFFQTLMPVLGWLIGKEIATALQASDHWVAFALLLLLGGKMILEGIKAGPATPDFNPFKPLTLVTMAVATSIDALVVGLSFGFLGSNIWIALLMIGSVTFLVSMLGMLFGKKIGSRIGKKAEIVGGAILILIGLKILLEHLSVW